MTRAFSAVLWTFRVLCLLALMAAAGGYIYMLFRYGPTWDWHQQWNYLYGNRVALGAAILLAITAAVRTSPKDWPAGKEDWWTWMRNWLHVFYNIPNTDPPPPGGAPTPKA